MKKRDLLGEEVMEKYGKSGILVGSKDVQIWLLSFLYMNQTIEHFKNVQLWRSLIMKMFKDALTFLSTKTRHQR